jgi:hypothetical protein
MYVGCPTDHPNWHVILLQRWKLMGPRAAAALEEVMENFAELMQRLLEIQSGGRQRSPELIAEDERLMDGLQKRNLAGKPTQTVKLSQDSPERAPRPMRRAEQSRPRPRMQAWEK